MSYPSTATAFVDPTPSDRLSTTPHSSIETAQNDAIERVEAFIGTLSSTAGTLIYDIRASASNGGGHVQTANKGGTGQTSYNKGDLLVATSSSVLTKLSVGPDGTILTANSSVSSGLEYQAGVTSPQVQKMSFQYAQNSGSGSVYAISPTPCVLSYATGQMFMMLSTATNTVVKPALSVSSMVSKSIVHPDYSSVLVGEIKASSIGLYGYDGANFQLMSQITPTTTNQGIFARAGGPSGSNAVQHRLGSKPRYVRVTAMQSGAAAKVAVGGTNFSSSLGIHITVDASQQADSSATNVITLQEGTNLQTATVAADSSMLTFTWASVNGISNDNIYVFWEATT